MRSRDRLLFTFERSMSAFLQIKLENRRPIPLMAVIANIMFRVPSMFVFWTRRICWNLSGETSDILFVRIYQSKWKNHKHLYEPDSALMYSVMILQNNQFRVGLGTRIRLPFRWVSCRRCRKFPICVQHQSAWFCRGGSRNTDWDKKFKISTLASRDQYVPWEVWLRQVWHGFSFRQFRQGSTNHPR